MDRKQFLQKLEAVAPALSNHNMVPILTHIWCTGTTLVAFNDQIAISVPCKTEFKGAVPGTTLLGMVKTTTAKEIELLPSDKELQVKMGSSRFKLGMLPPEDFVFEMPKPNQQNSINMQEFVACIDRCMISVSTDESIKDQLGVTLVPNGKTLDMYSTNNATLSHTSVKGNGGIKNRAVLSGVFCKEMLKLAKTSESVKLEVHDNYSLLTTDDGTILYGHLVEVEKPIDFADIIKHNFPDKAKAQLIPIKPFQQRLKLIMERAIIITDSSTDPGVTVVTIKDDGKGMRFMSRSPRGEIADNIPEKDIGEHPQVTIKIDPKLLKAGYGVYDKLLLTESCAVMANDDGLYLVSATG